MNRKYYKLSGETGRIVEEEFLGLCKVSWDGKTYLKFREALEQARRSQTDNPSAPSHSGAAKLHAAVAEKMGLADRRRLSLFTAIGTALDRCHGVDAWFEFEGAIVTIDVTMNPQKERAKANVVVNVQEAVWDFEFVADEIAQAFYWQRQPSVHAPKLAFGKEAYVSNKM